MEFSFEIRELFNAENAGLYEPFYFGIIARLCPIRLECASIAAAATCRLSLYGYSVKTIRYNHFRGMEEVSIFAVPVSTTESLESGWRNCATIEPT